MFSRTRWHTTSIEKATGAFSRTFGKAKLVIHECPPALDVQFDVISLGNASLVRNRLGPEVTLSCERTTDYLFTVARKGNSTFQFNGEVFACNSRRGTVLSPVRNLSIRRSRGSENTVLSLNSEAVHTTLRALIGEKLPGPVLFDPDINVRGGNGASMKRHIEHLFGEVCKGDTGMAVPQVAEATSRALITNALYLLRHNYSKMLTGRRRKPPMTVVSRVEKFIEANHQRAVSDGVLADIGRKSSSALYRIFIEQRGYTPMQFLRRTRMLHTRKRLLSPGPEDTVTLIATDCGFTHLSRFASDYRRQYGEKPSDTLKKTRSS